MPDANLNLYEVAIVIRVDQRSPVLPPGWSKASRRGDLFLCAQARERNHKDLVGPLFPRTVGDPEPVGWEETILEIKRALKQETRYSFAVRGQRPEAGLVVLVAFRIKKKFPIGRPVLWKLVVRRFQQQLLAFRSGHRFPVQICVPNPIGSVYDLAPVGRPHRHSTCLRAERELGSRITLEVINPKIMARL